MRRTGTTRRGVLTASGAVALGAVLTGCGGGADSEPSGGTTSADARTASARARTTAQRTAAARTSHALLTRYAEVAAAHPAAEAGLAPLRAAVEEHARAFAKAVPAPAPPTASPAPGDARAALKSLAAEERRVADDRARTLLDAEPELARLLASVAAAGAVHAYLLTELAKEVSS
ncbi:hypothetical protein OG909_24380 [Streptomyces sp. NBC_01754]|uniref:hypothetical protein n=1 Tax=Streptomyces sp. NBC_01754 TaxID=2975930 RepID=UPI002DD91EF7|nr:hypothetical protein [Streptomyces sp. NBC_01754]WSC95157.1 hypothetical protein OG909_24380 [Streptomyces sp. NBC_01754]